MATIFWPESYPNLVQRARFLHAAGKFVDAGVEFLKAAAVAPSVLSETERLFDAWICVERAGGRVSELEGENFLGDVA